MIYLSKSWFISYKPYNQPFLDPPLPKLLYNTPSYANSERSELIELFGVPNNSQSNIVRRLNPYVYFLGYPRRKIFIKRRGVRRVFYLIKKKKKVY